MSLYDALDALGGGLVAISVDVPGWVVVNLDTGKIEQLYIESQELHNVEPHKYVTSDGGHYNVGFEVERDEKGYPAFLDELDNDATIQRAAKILSEQSTPDPEVYR